MTKPIDPAKLREDFAAMEMPGVVNLIDMILESKRRNKEIFEIGSSSIGKRIIVSMAKVYEAAQKKFPEQPFPFFYLGRRASRDGKRPVLSLFAHLDLLRQVVAEVPAEQRKDFDLFCGTLAESQARLAARDVEGTDKDGHYRIPKDEWNRAQQDPTYIPTKIRIPKLSIDSHLPKTRFDAPFDDPTGPLNPNNG
jgi:hypothetical protein